MERDRDLLILHWARRDANRWEVAWQYDDRKRPEPHCHCDPQRDHFLKVSDAGTNGNSQSRLHPSRRTAPMLIREKLVRAELAAARLKIREVGGNNHGPQVKAFLAEVGLPEGYAWCDAFQSYEMHAAAGHRLPIESASVAQTYAVARKLGWLAFWPARGDLVLYDFDGDGRTNDHIGIVVKVSDLGVFWKLNTVEGNTGDGSAADGDGVYVRTRVVGKRSVSFVRIPGYVPAQKPDTSKQETMREKRRAKAISQTTPKKPAARRGGSNKAA